MMLDGGAGRTFGAAGGSPLAAARSDERWDHCVTANGRGDRFYGSKRVVFDCVACATNWPRTRRASSTSRVEGPPSCNCKSVERRAEFTYDVDAFRVGPRRAFCSPSRSPVGPCTVIRMLHGVGVAPLSMWVVALVAFSLLGSRRDSRLRTKILHLTLFTIVRVTHGVTHSLARFGTCVTSWTTSSTATDSQVSILSVSPEPTWPRA
jgi:hypothetical protein